MRLLSFREDMRQVKLCSCHCRYIFEDFLCYHHLYTIIEHRSWIKHNILGTSHGVLASWQEKVICLIPLTEIKTMKCKFLERLNQSELKNADSLSQRVCLCLLWSFILLCGAVFICCVFVQISVCWIVNLVLIVSCGPKQKINASVCGV